MADEMTLRSAFHGFNRRDVLACIERLNSEHKSRVQSLEGQLRQLREENDRLQAQLEEARAKAAEPARGDTQELEAYRRAERTEREARERADRMTKEAVSALTDMRRMVGESTKRLNSAMEAWTAAVEFTREEIRSVSNGLPREE